MPVWFALIVVAIAHEVVSHHHVAGATIWLNNHAVGLSARPLAHDLTLIDGAGDGGFTGVLWSLKWEVIFSLLLPLYLWIGRRYRPAVGASACLLIVLVAGDRNAYAQYLPPFMLGVILAFARHDLARCAAIPRGPRSDR
jgi:peptidoglycan/LPS O-acetylase OafA/YrhL